jgi:hypothetical protein
VLEAFDDRAFADVYVEAIGISVVFTAAGQGLVAWTGRSGDVHAVRSAILQGRALRRRTTLSASGTEAQLQALSLGPRGEALALWTLGPQSLTDDLMASARPSGARLFGAPEAVSAPEDAQGSGFPDSFNPAAATAVVDPVTHRPLGLWLAARFQLRYALRAPIG